MPTPSRTPIPASLPARGLTAAEVAASRQQHGANVLTPPQREPWWRLFAEKFSDPAIRILIVAAAIALGVGSVRSEYAEALGIIAAILLATTIAFLNEYRANRAFDILNQVYDDVRVRVLRDGSYTTIARRDLVVGDWVYVETGEEIPADGEVIEGMSLLIDQAKLTGESEPVQKFPSSDTAAIATCEATYPPNFLYRSTIVDQGNAWFRVTAVGDRTEIGRLAIAVASVDASEETPLNRQLERLSQLIGAVGLTFASSIFVALLVRAFATGEFDLSGQQIYVLLLIVASVIVAIAPVWIPIVNAGLALIRPTWRLPVGLEDDSLQGWLRALAVGGGGLAVGLSAGALGGWLPPDGTTWLPAEVGAALLQYFMVAVTIVVVAVPEGLPMSVTLSLAYSMRRMAAANNLVRRLHACETIGAATTICSDKTGTLTQNRMRVAEANFPGLQASKLTDLDFAKNLIAEAIAANSTADLDRPPHQPPQPLGNPTEGALLLWLQEQNCDYLTYRQGFTVKFRLSFSPQNKCMATLGTSGVTGHEILHVKGAPEILLERCSHILTEYGCFPLHNQEPILALLKSHQARGMRVLALAYQDLPDNLMQPDGFEIGHYLTWLGCVAIADPLRERVPEAIQSCLQAGIRVKIVTGDGPATAQEIARQVGLWQPSDAQEPYALLTGKEFRALPDAEASQAARALKVLARAIPSDKLRLVNLLQAQGDVVAVTGDGTNDAAALKQARVGLAMGSGTAIAKEASDIILLDDSFHSIVNAVIWGRSLYKNIQRFVLFQLAINVVALGIVLIGPFIGVSLPLTVTQMLWVNLIMDTFAALALATEPPNPKVLEEPPRSPEAFIITPEMARHILTAGGIFLGFLTSYLLYLLRNDVVDPRELSAFFAVFVFLQFWNLFNVRCWGSQQSALQGLQRSRGFLAIAATIAVGQVVIVQFGGEMFRTVPLRWDEWLAIVSSTSLVLWCGEAWRWLERRWGPAAN